MDESVKQVVLVVVEYWLPLSRNIDDKS